MATDEPVVLGRRFRRLGVAAAAFAAVAVDCHGDPAFYFAYFTILTNLSIGTWFLAAALGLAVERLSVVRLSLTVSALMTVLVYWTFLAPTHHPQGLSFVANLALHAVVPAAMALEDWLVPWPRIQAFAPGWVVLFPVLYCTLSLFRGELTGWYPYFFLNKAEMGGWLPLLGFAAALLMGFVGIGYGWTAVVHRRGRKAAAM